MNIKQWIKGSFLYYVAGALLVLDYLSLWFLDTSVNIQLLRYVGGTILVIGIVLIFLPRFVFRSKGRPEKGRNWTDTTVVVDTGIYAIVRHPLYLGWLLMYVALILLSQHWLTVIIGIPGMACVYLISRQEDQHLIEKFGDDYEDYMNKVPRMNLLVGIIQLVQRRNRG